MHEPIQDKRRGVRPAHAERRLPELQGLLRYPLQNRGHRGFGRADLEGEPLDFDKGTVDSRTQMGKEPVHVLLAQARRLTGLVKMPRVDFLETIVVVLADSHGELDFVRRELRIG